MTNKFNSEGRAARRAKWLVSTLVLLLGTQLWAQPQTSVAPGQLVRRVIAKELAANGDQGPNWMYQLRRETDKGVQVKQMVETRDGIVARLVSVNDRPLTDAERKIEEGRIQRLLNDPNEQRKKAQEQRQEAQRVTNMLKSMPDAFLYEYDGTEPGVEGEMLRLRFKPNPEWNSGTRETLPFKAMTGMMWIDASDERMVRIDATLIEDVTLGWGLVARLNKGGRFQIEQSRVGTDWVISRMQLGFEGKALLFKTIKIRQQQKLSGFRKVPKTLSLADGVNLLRGNETAVFAAGK